MGKISWRRAWQPTPAFLPGESPWTEAPNRLLSIGAQRVEQLSMHTCIILYTYNIPLSSAGTKAPIQVEDVGSCLPPPHFNQLKICLPLSQYCAEFSSLQAPSRICMLLFLVSKSCPTVCYPMDYSPPGFSVHGISQARILEWVAFSFSRGSSQPRDQTRVSCIGRGILYH